MLSKRLVRYSGISHRHKGYTTIYTHTYTHTTPETRGEDCTLVPAFVLPSLALQEDGAETRTGHVHVCSQPGSATQTLCREMFPPAAASFPKVSRRGARMDGVWDSRKKFLLNFASGVPNGAERCGRKRRRNLYPVAKKSELARREVSNLGREFVFL